MYRCKECGHLFEDGEQAIWEERHGLDTPPYEKIAGCPICKSAYVEADGCKKCGSYRKEMQENYCETCKMDIQEKFLKLLEKNFCEDELDELCGMYDCDFFTIG